MAARGLCTGSARDSSSCADVYCSPPRHDRSSCPAGGMAESHTMPDRKMPGEAFAALGFPTIAVLEAFAHPAPAPELSLPPKPANVTFVSSISVAELMPVTP